MVGESSSGRPAEMVKAVFIEDVAAFMQGKQVEDVLIELRERLRGLRAYEQQELQHRKRLLEKLPEIKKSLDVVNALVEKRGTGDVVAADFELADGIYAKANMQVGGGVCGGGALGGCGWAGSRTGWAALQGGGRQWGRESESGAPSRRRELNLQTQRVVRAGRGLREPLAGCGGDV